MKLSEAKKGMIVLVSNDISKTSYACTSTNAMHGMKNKICTIEDIDGKYVYIYHPNHGHWWFHPHDIYIIPTDKQLEEKKEEKRKEFLFDPINILT